ncbi:hypothetical protein BDZ94DRAFT_1315863 [Collybia nuda]|uniref:Uncharacterized protein n=1 Tax=Collybia nuda TaxID=64659 RepID=A0A9P6CC54_9AGAR|nr:hypothetical protein BDZ94DRAFT_1315863 [Collybia nuda]
MPRSNNAPPTTPITPSTTAPIAPPATAPSTTHPISPAKGWTTSGQHRGTPLRGKSIRMHAAPTTSPPAPPSSSKRLAWQVQAVFQTTKTRRGSRGGTVGEGLRTGCKPSERKYRPVLYSPPHVSTESVWILAVHAD